MTDIPVYLGKVSDVASGKIQLGYAFIHGLMSSDELYGKADVYDRPFGTAQLRVEPHHGGVTVSVWDLQIAIDSATENAAMTDQINGGSSSRNTARKVIRYASTIGSTPRAMRVT